MSSTPEPNTADASEWAEMVKKKPHNKYGVGNKERRIYLGHLYASVAESRRAAIHEMRRRNGDVSLWLRQPLVDLGEDDTFRLDFFVLEADGVLYFEDVKGFETTPFRRMCRLWDKYGPAPLHVVYPKKTVVIAKGWKI